MRPSPTARHLVMCCRLHCDFCRQSFCSATLRDGPLQRSNEVVPVAKPMLTEAHAAAGSASPGSADGGGEDEEAAAAAGDDNGDGRPMRC